MHQIGQQMPALGEKVHQADTVPSRHAQICRKCRKTMVSLQADETLLERYKPLVDQDLKVTTAASDPNGSVHRMADLA
jgi:predicted methyltransferase